MSDDSPDHVEGVVFSDINPTLEEISYPIRKSELIDQFGDREVERANANPISIGELFDRMGGTTFESPESIRQMMLSQMPRNSEGRTNYSDRGGATPVETEAAAEASEQTSADLEGQATDPDRRGPKESE